MIPWGPTPQAPKSGKPGSGSGEAPGTLPCAQAWPVPHRPPGPLGAHCGELGAQAQWALNKGGEPRSLGGVCRRRPGPWGRSLHAPRQLCALAPAGRPEPGAPESWKGRARKKALLGQCWGPLKHTGRAPASPHVHPHTHLHTHHSRTAHMHTRVHTHTHAHTAALQGPLLQGPLTRRPSLAPAGPAQQSCRASLEGPGSSSPHWTFGDVP